MELRNYDLSLKLADSAIKVSPNYAKALNLKAASLLNLGKAIDAEKYFTKAIEAYPNYTEAIKNRGIVRLKTLIIKKELVLISEKQRNWVSPEWIKY